jgi:hypothetical protein
MFVQNTVKHPSGEILTGKIWRKEHHFLKNLPFYSGIPQMDAMDKSLEDALDKSYVSDLYKVLLVVCKLSSVFLNLIITCLRDLQTVLTTFTLSAIRPEWLLFWRNQMICFPQS